MFLGMLLDTIRGIAEDDLPAIIELISSMDGLASDRPSVHWLFPNFFKDTSFVAVVDGALVGFAYSFINQVNPDEGYLYLLGVSSRFRRRGIAQQLVRKCAESLKAKGCRSMVLTTTPSNLEAQAFYQAVGFGTAQPFLKAGQPRLMLRKFF